jgi:hypothetical protein
VFPTTGRIGGKPAFALPGGLYKYQEQHSSPVEGNTKQHRSTSPLDGTPLPYYLPLVRPDPLWRCGLVVGQTRASPVRISDNRVLEPPNASRLDRPPGGYTILVSYGPQKLLLVGSRRLPPLPQDTLKMALASSDTSYFCSPIVDSLAPLLFIFLFAFGHPFFGVLLIV